MIVLEAEREDIEEGLDLRGMAPDPTSTQRDVAMDLDDDDDDDGDEGLEVREDLDLEDDPAEDDITGP